MIIVRKEVRKMNNVCIIGRLTKELALLKTNNGKSFLRFTVAVNRDKDNADFVPCVAWNQTAENMVKYCRKGSLIAVSGSITTGSYDNNEGKRVYTFDVMANRVVFLEPKGNNSGTQETTDTMAQNEPQSIDYGLSITSDDLPF
jgi:single-strand DNA-binding protein